MEGGVPGAGGVMYTQKQEKTIGGMSWAFGEENKKRKTLEIKDSVQLGKGGNHWAEVARNHDTPLLLRRGRC